MAGDPREAVTGERDHQRWCVWGRGVLMFWILREDKLAHFYLGFEMSKTTGVKDHDRIGSEPGVVAQNDFGLGVARVAQFIVVRGRRLGDRRRLLAMIRER